MQQFSHTICFLRQGESLVMLNRRYAPNQGLWNGVGGRIEPGETPSEGIIREIQEEVGISLLPEQVQSKGYVTWWWLNDDDGLPTINRGGMHLFCAELPGELPYPLPLRSEEGLLDMLPAAWITEEGNTGVVSNIPFIFRYLFDDPQSYEHRCIYQKVAAASGDIYILSDVQAIPLD